MSTGKLSGKGGKKLGGGRGGEGGENPWGIGIYHSGEPVVKLTGVGLFLSVHVFLTLSLSKSEIVNSLLWPIHIALWIIYKNMVVDEDNNFYLIRLRILISCFLYYVWILLEKLHVNYWGVLGCMSSLPTVKWILNKLVSIADTPTGYMSEDGGSPRPVDPNAMEVDNVNSPPAVSPQTG